MTYTAEQITFMLSEAIDENREYKSWHCSTQHLMALVERVVAEEREACAKVCDAVAQQMDDEGEGPTGNIGWVSGCAEAIRARGNI